jgi:uncharacterized protein (TIGR02145 family)
MIRGEVFFWSATEYGNYAWNRYVGYYYQYVTNNLNSKSVGDSVRCLRD